jgi:hypothetical protein
LRLLFLTPTFENSLHRVFGFALHAFEAVQNDLLLVAAVRSGFLDLRRCDHLVDVFDLPVEIEQLIEGLGLAMIAQ